MNKHRSTRGQSKSVMKTFNLQKMRLFTGMIKLQIIQLETQEYDGVPIFSMG